jgi:hypothetical protein
VQLYDDDCSTEDVEFENLVMIGMQATVIGPGSNVSSMYTGPSRAFQTRGEMIAHRPTYVVMKELPSVLNRFTTNLNLFGVAGTSSVPGCEEDLLCDTDTVDFWNYYDKYDNPQAITLLRFHLVVIHPGDTHTWHDGYTSFDASGSGYDANDDSVPTLDSLKTGIDKCCWENFQFDFSDGTITAPTCGNTNDYCCESNEDGTDEICYDHGLELVYDGVDDFGEWAENDHSNAVVFNMRTKSITHRIPLENCGDGIKDSETQWFEECERFNVFNDDCFNDLLDETMDSNKYCPGQYLYNCGAGGISEYCYFNEETGLDSNGN